MNWMYEKLKQHIGHNIVCVAYGDINNPVDICIECEDCFEVLVSAEDFEENYSETNVNILLKNESNELTTHIKEKETNREGVCTWGKKGIAIFIGADDGSDDKIISEDEFNENYIITGTSEY